MIKITEEGLMGCIHLFCLLMQMQDNFPYANQKKKGKTSDNKTLYDLFAQCRHLPMYSNSDRLLQCLLMDKKIVYCDVM